MSLYQRAARNRCQAVHDGLGINFTMARSGWRFAIKRCYGRADHVLRARCGNGHLESWRACPDCLRRAFGGPAMNARRGEQRMAVTGIRCPWCRGDAVTWLDGWFGQPART